MALLLFLLPLCASGKALSIHYEHSADSLVRRAIQWGDSSEVGEYNASLYVKGNIEVQRRNFTLDWIPNMPHFKRGVKEYLMEMYYDVQYTREGSYCYELKSSQGTFHRTGDVWESITDFFQSDLFAPTLFAGKNLSPLNLEGYNYYRYRFDSVFVANEDTCYKITFAPKLKSILLFTGGYFIVSASHSKVLEACLKGWNEQCDYEVFFDMDKGRTLCSLPSLIDIKVRYHFLWNKVRFHFMGAYLYHSVADESEEASIRQNHSYDLTNLYFIGNGNQNRVEQPMEKFRPVKLSRADEKIYKEYSKQNKSDSVFIRPHRSSWATNFLLNAGEALISSHSIDFSQDTRFRLSPVISPSYLSYSSNTGVSYKLMTDLFSTFKDNRTIKIRPQMGYNFKLNEFYWKIDNHFNYLPSRMGSLDLSVGNGNRIYSSDVLDDIKSMSDSDRYDLSSLRADYFRDFYVKFTHSIELSNGLLFSAGASYHIRTQADSPFVDDKKKTTASLDPTHVLKKAYRSFAPHFSLQWTPGQYYYREGGQKKYLYSHYPTFIFDWEQGIDGILGSDGNYSRFETDVQYSLPLGTVSKLFLRAGGGAFFKQKHIYFVDYSFFSHSNLPTERNDEIGGVFQLLDSRWYNAANNYARANATYESPFFLLHHIFRNTSFIQSERIYFNALCISHLLPYIEWGYGLETPYFDAGLFVSNQNGQFHSVGFKFTLTFFN